MNLLARAARDVVRLATPEVGFTVAVAGLVFAVEALGRQSGTDLHDLLAISSLVMLGVLVGIRHRRTPMAWVAAFVRTARKIGQRLHQGAFEIGLDLRGEPRVKAGSPRIVVTLAVILALWTALAAIFAGQLPRDWRSAAVHVFYIGYLIPLAGLWLSAILLGLLAAFLPFAMIHDAFVAAHTAPGSRSRRGEVFAVVGYYFGLMALGTILPVGVSLLICGALLTAYMVVCRISGREEIRFLWRPAGTVRVRSLTWSDWVTWEFLLITLAVFAVVLTTCGDRLWPGTLRAETMPITALLGMTLAWLAPGALAALFLQMTLGRFRDPARPIRPVVSIAGAESQALRSRLRKVFAEHGWKVRFGRPSRRALAVPVHYSPEARLGYSDEPHWPLPVAADELRDPALWERLGRRSEIQLRRKLMTALERLFKLAAGRRSRPGNGYWVAPHFWFVPGLMRDSQRDADDDFELADQSLLSSAVGPPYHRVLPRAVRHHVWTLLRALQVDLIFVEDNVSFRRFRRVLRVLFEVFDMHGGRRAVNEIDFRGLPGIRVLIHEFQFDEPFKSEVYPEPKYDYLGRARILHVFRDRGGQEELIEPPFDASRTPAPAALV